MTGAAFTSSRQTYLAAVSNLPTETPMYHDIPIYVATWVRRQRDTLQRHPRTDRRHPLCLECWQ